MGLSFLGPATTALMVSQGFEFALRGETVGSNPTHSTWSLLWPKLIVFLPIIFYALLCWPKWARQYQLKVAEWLTLFYSFFMIYVFVALIVQGIQCPLNPTFLFFCTLSGIVIICGVMHGDLVSLMCGIVYWAAIPSCFILLQLYSIANLNDCSWGTRQSGGGGAKSDTPVDKAVKQFKGWCCKSSGNEQSKPSENQLDSIVTDDAIFSTISFSNHHHKCDNDNNIKRISSALNRDNNDQWVHVDDMDEEQHYKISEILKLENVKKVTCSTFNASWLISAQSPQFFRNNPKLKQLTTVEATFWSGMVDRDDGFIRNFKNSRNLKRQNEELTSEMDCFRDKLYGYYLYINVAWVTICILAQNYSNTWTLKLLSSETINALVKPSCATSTNLTQSEELTCAQDQKCIAQLERGFAPLEFFFLFFYLILIGIQFSSMIVHR